MDWSSVKDEATLAVSAIAAVILAGLGIRSRNSKVSTQVANDDAEKSKAKAEGRYFEGAIDAITKHRDRLQDLLEKERIEHAAALVEERKISFDIRSQVESLKLQIVAIESELRHQKSSWGFRTRALRARYPDVNFDLLDSEPAALGPPEIAPMKSITPERRKPPPEPFGGPVSDFGALDD